MTQLSHSSKCRQFPTTSTAIIDELGEVNKVITEQGVWDFDYNVSGWMFTPGDNYNNNDILILPYKDFENIYEYDSNIKRYIQKPSSLVKEEN